MKFNFPINNFSSGEWSPKMGARTDTEQYFRACEALKNAIVQMQGGAFRRPGTAYITLDTYQSYLGTATLFKLVPIALSDGSRYVLVCTDDKPGTGAYKWFVYNNATGATALLNPSVYADFADTGISSAQFTQQGDTIFIVTGSGGGPPRYLKPMGDAFTGPVAWDFRATWEYFLPDGSYHKGFPFGPVQALGIAGTITVTGTFTVGGTVTLVATSTSNMFYSAMIRVNTKFLGCHFKFTSGTTTGVVEITAVTDGQNATGIVRVALPAASGTAFGLSAGTAFEKSAWNGYDGYPKTLVGYQGRMIYGGNAGQPSTVWGSRIGNVFDMMEVPFAQDPAFTSYANDNSRPFTFIPTAAEGSNIMALSSAKTLVINTDRSEIVAQGTQGALGPNDVSFESSTSFGAAPIQPTRIASYLTFVQRGAKRLRDLIFNFQEYQYKSADLSFVADHLFIENEFAELAAAELLSSVLFCRTAQGRVYALTLDRDYQVNAWSPIVFGGSNMGLYSDDHTECLGMCGLPGVNTRDSVYFLLKRTINGVPQVYLEKLSQFHEYPGYDGTIYPYPQYMDSWKLVTNGSPLTVTPGFTHLAGQTVQVLADGKYVGEVIVDLTGHITLPTAATAVQAGLKYQTVIRPLPIEEGAQFGSPLGQVKRVHEIFIKFFNSVGAKYGLVGGQFFDIDLRDPQTPSNAQTPLFTGYKVYKLPPHIARSFQVEINTDLPFPCNVLSITMKGMTDDQG